MPDHARKQIRDAVATALTGLTTTGSNVFKSRTQQIADDKLPALQVYTRDERLTADSMGGADRPRERELRLWVVGAVRTTSTEPDDTLDTICAEVETALGNSNNLSNLVRDLELVSTQIEVPTDPADKRAGRVGMTWRCTYRTPANAPASFV